MARDNHQSTFNDVIHYRPNEWSGSRTAPSEDCFWELNQGEQIEYFCHLRVKMNDNEKKQQVMADKERLLRIESQKVMSFWNLTSTI